MADRYVDVAYSVGGHFDASHHLPYYSGPCSAVHGHTWRVSVEMAFMNVPVYELRGIHDGILVDFNEVRQAWEQFDHADLNELMGNPTAELIAIDIYDKVVEIVRSKCEYTFKLVVNVMESEDAAVAVTTEEIPPSIQKQYEDALEKAERDIKVELEQQEAGLHYQYGSMYAIKVD